MIERLLDCCRACPWCRSEFIGSSRNQIYCSDHCNNVAKKNRRKRIQRGAPRTLPLPSVWDVYERDRGVCQLCGEGVERSLRWPDQAAASIDHVVPVSLGGHEAGWNYQLAHLRCNRARQNKTLPVWYAERAREAAA